MPPPSPLADHVFPPPGHVNLLGKHLLVFERTDSPAHRSRDFAHRSPESAPRVTARVRMTTFTHSRTGHSRSPSTFSVDGEAESSREDRLSSARPDSRARGSTVSARRAPDHIHALANRQLTFAEHVFPSPECLNPFAERRNPFTSTHSRDRRAPLSRMEDAESDRGASEPDRRNGFSRSASVVIRSQSPFTRSAGAFSRSASAWTPLVKARESEPR
jgi:hypothetical protein